ncbi:MAG: hypothetical protein OK455_04910, partial [Thaumarchaeota archaeon]|nr:hypothetical protein [Nitrososphaerota archaeon]
MPTAKPTTQKKVVTEACHSGSRKEVSGHARRAKAVDTTTTSRLAGMTSISLMATLSLCFSFDNPVEQFVIHPLKIQHR